MPVYIDNFNAPYRGMKMCHMIADTSDELKEMAVKIGVSIRWIQEPGTPYEHFDICQSKKAEAIKHGAEEINMRDYAKMVNRRVATGSLHETIHPQNHPQGGGER